MSAPPYMKWFWADYHQDTRHLTRDQHGAYFLLIGEAWNNGGYLPDDDAKLAAWTLSTPAEWKRLKPVVMAFFRPASKGRWRHKRIASELATFFEISRKRKQAGKIGGAASVGTAKGNRQANAKQMPTKPEPEPEVRLEPIKGSKSNRRASAKALPEGAFATRSDEPPADHLTAMDRLVQFLARQDAEANAHAQA
jgi:uncharacterized protein YdaU (DUF1376 family)